MDSDDVRIDTHLTLLRGLLPKRVTSVRTDVRGETHGRMEPALVAEVSGKASTWLRLSGEIGVRRHAIGIAKQRLGVADEAAGELLDRAAALARLNPIGAWPLTVNWILSDTELDSTLGNPKFAQVVELARARDTVREVFPAGWRYTLTSGWSPDRDHYVIPSRCWLTAEDREGRARAAIDLWRVAHQIRECVMHDEITSALASTRLNLWAGQLGIAREAFIAGCMALDRILRFAPMRKDDDEASLQ